MHLRVVRREPDRRGVLAQVGDPERTGIGDQLPEHALALGQGPHARGELLVDAHGDEGGQPVTLADDPERAVAGVDEFDAGLDDAPQGAVQVQPGGHAEEGVEQLLHPALAAGDGGQPLLHLFEQLGQPHAGQRRGAVPRGRRGGRCSGAHAAFTP